MKIIYTLLFLLLFIPKTEAQYVFQSDNLPQKTSITHIAAIADAAQKKHSIQNVKNNSANFVFRPFDGERGNLGFTKNNFWVKFEIVNSLNTPLFYYLEVAEPVTDNVNLYLFDAAGKLSVQKSGDNLPFPERSVEHRKTLFKIELLPKEKKLAFIEIQNDGEKNNLPLNLISPEQLLKTTYQEQIIFGLFYGILLAVAVTYLFFFFALNERSFLYYVLYVVFVALCHFSLDGFFHQYTEMGNSWFSLHSVILFALLGSFFFGKYCEVFLDIRNNNKTLYKAYQIIYVLLAAVLLAIIFIPAFLEFSYPVVNALTLMGIVLILVSVINLYHQKQSINVFFISGLAVLFICFAIVILLNFGIIPSYISIDNLTKLGIGLEIIALSLSMAERIRQLKSNKEELQAIALQRSEEMNEIKSCFLSNMSHELRTPLNAIYGLTSSMEIDSSDPKIKANCEIIKQISHNLISSVNDILDFSKIEKGNLILAREKFDPLATLEKLKLIVQRQAEEKGLAFEFYRPAEKTGAVIGDPVRLEQIVNNVLNNAIKYTERGLINFKIDISIKENDRINLKLIISDTGIGIPAEKITSIFGMFTQTNINNKRKFGGFGIGLCVVKALVDMHQGSIELDSKLGEGTTCTINLDYDPAPPEKAIINVYPTDSYDLMGMHILVVEDNQMNQMVIKMMLKKWLNTTASFASDGAESIELLKSTSIDIVLMDLQMPVMDGYEAVTAIRSGLAGENNTDIPIIVLTADSLESTKQRVIGLGVNDYMTKPVDQKLLYQKVTTIMSCITA